LAIGSSNATSFVSAEDSTIVVVTIPSSFSIEDLTTACLPALELGRPLNQDDESAPGTFLLAVKEAAACVSAVPVLPALSFLCVYHIFVVKDTEFFNAFLPQSRLKTPATYERPESGPLGYVPLQDKYLKRYFSSPIVAQHLRKIGLIKGREMCQCYIMYVKHSKGNVDQMKMTIQQQQHSGGNMLTVFRDMIYPNEKITFGSYRRIGQIFAIVISIDDQVLLRLNTCCESRYKPGGRLGGKSSPIKWLGTKYAVPCYK
uniref:DUF4590 domain-containing protein n=1 Tax=Romanomermis culicivorax TaxID=13658 RepID=A0A915K801_ROMCU